MFIIYMKLEELKKRAKEKCINALSFELAIELVEQEKRKTAKEIFDVMKSFIDDTPQWYEGFNNPNKQCIVCGIIPNNMINMANKLKKLMSKYHYEK